MKKNNLNIGIIEGKPSAVTLYYHKDNDITPTSALSIIARQLELFKGDLIKKIKNR